MQVTPNLETVLAHRGEESHVALTLAIRADLDSPIAIFRKLADDSPNSFLLESVEGGELMGRYTFMGAGVVDSLEWRDGVATLRRGGETRRVAGADPLEALRAVLSDYRVLAAPDLPRFQGGAVGWIGFDCVSAFEPVPLPPTSGVRLPPVRMLLPEDVVIYDHLSHRVILVAHAALAGDRRAAWEAAAARLHATASKLAAARLESERPWSADRPSAGDIESIARPNRSRADYIEAVGVAKEAIAAGEVFQVVISQRFTVEAAVDPFTLYRSLRALNPSPYMFYLRFDDVAVVGSSPEVLVRLEGDDLLVRPIAGTRPRGRTPDDDVAHERDLLADEKELAEHRMLVDLGRNDVSRVAAVGTVRVEDPLHIERFSHVMHLVTDVRGKLAEGRDAFDVFRACFPAGTVSGAPKVRACELLARLEPDRRGLYAGAVGYFDYAGNMDTCIAIRTLVVEAGAVHVQAGAGIVHDSVPESEYEECRNKARAPLTAVAMALERAGTTTQTTGDD